MDELAKLQNKTAHQLAMEVIRNYASAQQNGKGEWVSYTSSAIFLPGKMAWGERGTISLSISLCCYWSVTAVMLSFQIFLYHNFACSGFYKTFILYCWWTRPCILLSQDLSECFSFIYPATKSLFHACNHQYVLFSVYYPRIMQPVPVLDNGVQKQPGKPLFFCHPAILDGQLLHFHLNSFRRCTTNLIWSLFGIFEFLMFPFFMFFKWDRLDSVLNSCTIEVLR